MALALAWLVGLDFLSHFGERPSPSGAIIVIPIILILLGLGYVIFSAIADWRTTSSVLSVAALIGLFLVILAMTLDQRRTMRRDEQMAVMATAETRMVKYLEPFKNQGCDFKVSRNRSHTDHLLIDYRCDARLLIVEIDARLNRRENSNFDPHMGCIVLKFPVEYVHDNNAIAITRVVGQALSEGRSSKHFHTGRSRCR